MLPDRENYDWMDFHNWVCHRCDPPRRTWAEERWEVLWGIMAGALKRCYPGLEEWLRRESVGKALLAYRRQPERFDAAQGSLASYLEAKARIHLRKRRRKEWGRQRRERSGLLRQENFEEKSGARVIGGIKGVLYGIEGDEEEKELKRQALIQALSKLGPCYRALVGLWLNDIDTVEGWAQHMGIGHLPPEEQKRQVRAVKARLVRRLKKLAHQELDALSE